VKPRHASAFTLIELLVVIGIIALLMGMTVPALFAIRRVARVGACQTKTGQVATAVGKYAKDHNEFYPGPKFDGTALQSLALAGEPGSSGSNGGNTPEDKRPINKYIGSDYEIMQCPLDRGCSKAGISDSLFEATGSSYWYYTHTQGYPNYFAMENVFILAGQRTHRVISPSTKMVVADAVITRSLFPNIGNDPRDEWHSNDNAAEISIGFADGSSGPAVRKTKGSGSPTGVTDATIKGFMNDDEGYY
jgi:prepilin-type N-terminal cleavage/methylation domain-containing protein